MIENLSNISMWLVFFIIIFKVFLTKIILNLAIYKYNFLYFLKKITLVTEHDNKLTLYNNYFKSFKIKQNVFTFVRIMS